MKILVLGFFGFLSKQLDGQTVRTRSVYKLIQNLNDDTKYIDTQEIRRCKPKIINLFCEVLKADCIVILPGMNNIKYIVPILYVISKFFNKKMIYIPIGGWLSKLLSERKMYIRFFKNAHAILPQTQALVSELKSLFNFTNVYYFPNFRFEENDKIIHSNENKKIKLVFYSRINKKKGLDYIFALCNFINANNLKEYEIDFYGPVAQDDQDYFFKQIDSFSFVSYKGILKPENVYSILCTYDLLMLPTRFYTEGFPGAILDAYMSYLPVIVTKWKHATEFVDNQQTGVIIPFDCSHDVFINEVIKITQNKKRLNELRIKAFIKSRDYTDKKASVVFQSVLNTIRFIK